jgi:hypothetical protein
MIKTFMLLKVQIWSKCYFRTKVKRVFDIAIMFLNIFLFCPQTFACIEKFVTCQRDVFYTETTNVLCHFDTIVRQVFDTAK